MYGAARGTKSTDFFQRYKPMGSHTLDHCFVVLIRNGLNPVPDIARDLLCRPHPFVFGDDAFCMSVQTKQGGNPCTATDHSGMGCALFAGARSPKRNACDRISAQVLPTPHTDCSEL